MYFNGKPGTKEGILREEEKGGGRQPCRKRLYIGQELDLIV